MKHPSEDMEGNAFSISHNVEDLSDEETEALLRQMVMDLFLNGEL